ncbi:MAG: hypothetical protein ACRCZ6_17605 [Kluyvera sp.]|uniref:hypothetical protein n=1 Tax=Kluyvera sp. TaxID=1538228 RepID=UPI003F2A0115
MNLFSLQTQRHLEDFLKQLGISDVSIDNPLQFSFPDHQLYIVWRHHQLWMTVILLKNLDDDSLKILFERVFSRLTTKYLLRPFRVTGGVALNVSLSDEVTSEQLVAVYQNMLRVFSPWKKRIYR